MKTLVRLGWIALSFSSWPAQAWYQHELLTSAILQSLSSELHQELARPVPGSCGEADHVQLQKLIQVLVLNPKATFYSTSAASCSTREPTSGQEILLHRFVDEPDQGMDQDLPDSADPNDDRRWMGGKTGTISQGFRHMYFGGIQPEHLTRTFQIPIHEVGVAPERVSLIAEEARALFKSGHTAWAYRTLAWALHYIQDLAQPFHAAQIPHLQMVPWHFLFEWPPSHGFDQLVKETTRSITNFHWAFEGYTDQRLKETESPYNACLSHPEQHATVLLTDWKTPKNLAHRVAAASVGLSTEVGRANLEFFGRRMKNPEVYLPENRGTPDYADLAIRPDLTQIRGSLEEVTCKALANSSAASRELIRWMVQ